MGRLTPRRLAAPALLVAVPLLGLFAPGAAAKTIHFVGGGLNDSGNQDQVKVSFKVHMEGKANKLHYVSDFTGKKIGFPNTTPPVPVGKPDCRYGVPPFCGSPPKTYLFTALEEPAPLDANQIPFDKDTPDEFFRKSQYPDAPFHPSEEWIARGIVRHSKKKGWHATGRFVLALSEGGLQYGGGSTGYVHWDAAPAG
jgi:hypothetical protein